MREEGLRRLRGHSKTLIHRMPVLVQGQRDYNNFTEADFKGFIVPARHDPLVDRQSEGVVSTHTLVVPNLDTKFSYGDQVQDPDSGQLYQVRHPVNNSDFAMKMAEFQEISLAEYQ